MEMNHITMQSKEVAELLKTLAHPNRLLILCLLKDGPMNVKDLQESIKVSQSQTSQFLKRMEREGLIKGERRAKSVYYSILDEKIYLLINALDDIFCGEKSC